MEVEEEKDKLSRRGSCFLMVFTVVCLCLAITIGLCLHFLLPKPQEPRQRTRAVGDCYPQGEVDRQKCEARGCEYSIPKDEREPKCIFPENSGYGYKLEGEPVSTPQGHSFTLRRIDRPTMYGNDQAQLKLDVRFHTESRLRIYIRDPEERRYQVPPEAVDIPEPSTAHDNDTRLYDVEWTDQPQFGLKVKRRSTGTVVFDTTVPGLTFSNQYLQLTTRLPSANVYGFGEHNHRQYRHDMNWKKWAIFTRDVAPVDEWNLYGAQPMYINLEEDGKANAVLLLNSNAMDVVTQPEPDPALSFHVIGGILDFYIFLGPTPENTVQQYTEAVGRPLMPPYWSLGFQLSRWDYDNITHVRHIVDRNRNIGIPQDVQYGDIDYMESKLDFTVDRVKYANLSDFVDELHSRGQRYIVIQDHAIGANATAHARLPGGIYYPFVRGGQHNIWINDSEGKTLVGEVWPGDVYYPDFTNPRSRDWWTVECEYFYNRSGPWKIEYDALWIDMNEPSNFKPGTILETCPKNSLNHPPYVPQILGAGDDGRMYDKTICMDAQQHWGTHYDVHSLYGHSMSIQSYHALRTLFPEKRPFVLTRSNFVGTQKYAAHWLGDNQSQWRQIPWSIVGMLEYSIFGFSYIGADICGFWYEATEEMCTRWMQLGAFYPFARNHNAATWPDQDPAAFSKAMQDTSRNILLTRYKLLPFLYTLMHHAHTSGTTVVRPLLHEFPTDRTTWTVDRQFLWGPSLLITPVMEEGATYVTGYFPKDRWYNYFGGEELKETGVTHNMSTPLDKINVHVRGGYIIPWQWPANTTVFSRRNNMGLLVALGSKPQMAASGDLFWDDGESFETQNKSQYLYLKFEATSTSLSMLVEQNGYREAGSLKFDTFNIWGLDNRPSSVNVDGTPLINNKITWNSAEKTMDLIDLSLNITLPHSITWTPSI